LPVGRTVDGHDAFAGNTAERCSRSVASGFENRLRRHEPPNDHSERCVGVMGNDLVIGADDVLVGDAVSLNKDVTRRTDVVVFPNSRALLRLAAARW
jgi:hypothetical protein